VTPDPARDVYGVVVDLEGERVDGGATARQRLALRRQRLGDREPRADTQRRAEVPRTATRVNEYLQRAGEGPNAFVQCTWCGARLCPGDADWKDHAARRTSRPAVAGPLRAETGPFFLLEFFCPECATLLDVDVALEGDAPLHDRITRWPG